MNNRVPKPESEDKFLKELELWIENEFDEYDEYEEKFTFGDGREFSDDYRWRET